MIDDAALLLQYAANRSEEAFATLVERHLNLVYRAALRQLNGDTHRAQDATQAVFALLARKASSLTRHTGLTGWLYTTTHHVISDMVRSERRRKLREQEAEIMQTGSCDAGCEPDWALIRPLLDEAMRELNGADREVLLLRYFQGLSFADVAAKISSKEDAARMRTDRAIDKLRTLLNRRGITSTTTVLAALLVNEAGMAAPADMVAAVVNGAMGSTVGATTAGSLLLMKTTTLIAAGMGIVLGSALVCQRIEIRRMTATEAGNEVRYRIEESQALQKIAAAKAAEASAVTKLGRLPTETEAERKGKARAEAINKLELRNPEYRALLAKSLRRDQLNRYNDLLSTLGLPADKLAKLKDLLVAWRVDPYFAEIAATDAGTGNDAQEASRARVEEDNKLRQEIDELLDSEGYSHVANADAYASLTSQEIFGADLAYTIGVDLSEAGMALTPDQSSALAKLQSEARAHGGEAWPSPQTGLSDMDQAVLTNAGGILTPAQMSIVESFYAEKAALGLSEAKMIADEKASGEIGPGKSAGLSMLDGGLEAYDIPSEWVSGMAK